MLAFVFKQNKTIKTNLLQNHHPKTIKWQVPVVNICRKLSHFKQRAKL
jgi:hypothetical protein